MNPLTTNTPHEVLAEAAEPVDALDALLRQIVNGYFVLTDGQGSVSKWSEPAELLFEQPSEDILGQGFFETLIRGSLPPAGQVGARSSRRASRRACPARSNSRAAAATDCPAGTSLPASRR